MNQAKEFDLYSILAVTHRLPSGALQYRTILAHMVGRDVSQVAGAGVCALTIAPECREWLLEQHPQLRNIPAPPDFRNNEAAMDAWAAEQAVRLGTDHLPVSPLPPDRPRKLSLGDLIDAIPDVNKAFVINPADLKGPTMGQANFDEVTRVMRPLMNDYFDLHRREMAKRDGEEWFVHDELADLAEEIAKWMEYFAAVFRRNAGFFRSGRH